MQLFSTSSGVQSRVLSSPVFLQKSTASAKVPVLQTPPNFERAKRPDLKPEHCSFQGKSQFISAVQSRQQRTSCISSIRAVRFRPSSQGLVGISPLPQTRVLEGIVGTGVGGSVGGAEGTGVGGTLGGAVGGAVGGFEGTGVGKAVGSAVGRDVGGFVGEGTGGGVGATGTGVGLGVGGFDGAEVGKFDGADVGFDEGGFVGSEVGGFTGAAVGGGVGGIDGGEVGRGVVATAPFAVTYVITPFQVPFPFPPKPFTL